MNLKLVCDNEPQILTFQRCAIKQNSKKTEKNIENLFDLNNFDSSSS